ncbi:glycosyltransferase involved in cell wall biosynthesis [Kibdelosporangium banguiense]|uniref:Glycosyltransferase involved in cell wall biosynthesis n=1 Tax=Kibdelosporangium banguiense TaxID=1365924 RepID=A0ABS4U372_9PSEU|nr:glycosyltransferase involved in cell wall biosynthesis [Kibdelosporangium banguiense]
MPDGDLVVATYWTTARLLTELAPRHGKPVHLVQLYEIWGVEDPSEVDNVLLQDVPKVAVSNHLAGTLRKLGVPDTQIAVVPNGLDHQVFHVTDRVTPREVLVSVLLSDSAQKGSKTAIDALIAARETVSNLTVVGFGTMSRPRDWPRWAHYLRAASGRELADLYRSSQVYLCSSASEGWGFPVAEAMACGAAVVTTSNGGVEDFCSNERNALIVPVGDATAMAAAVVRLIQDEQLRARLVQAGRETASEMDWSRSTYMFLAALRSAASVGG